MPSSDTDLFAAALQAAIAALIGLTCCPGQDWSILSTLMNGWDSPGYEHPLLRFFTMREARELRLVSREFKHNVEVTPWNDLTSMIGLRSYHFVGPCIRLWRECFSQAIAACILSYREHRLYDEDFIHFQGLRTLDISGCSGFTDAASPHLQELHTLKMSGCSGFTDAAFPYLQGLRTLDMSDCTGFTNAAFLYLHKLVTLTITGCASITNDTLVHFRGICSLKLGWGHELITVAECERQLRGITSLQFPRLTHPLIQPLMTSDTTAALRQIEEGDSMWIYANDHLDSSPLHWASKRGLDGIVFLLLQRGVDPRVQNCRRDTPLHWAAQNGNAAVVDLLLKWGADLNARNKEGNTPLAYAILENRKHRTDELTAFIAKIQRMGAM